MIGPTSVARSYLSRRLAAVLCACLGVGAGAALAQEEPRMPGEAPPTAEEGKRISEYDFAVSHAMRALMAAGPEQGRVTVYVARKEGDRWRVYFGSYDVRRLLFKIAYEVVQREEGSDQFAVRKYRRDIPADAELNRAATALVTALDAFEPKTVRFHTYVWRDADGRWVTYFVPTSVRRPLQEGLGHPAIDQRVLVSPDAREILESRSYPDPGAAEWVTPQEGPSLADLLALLLEPQLAPFRLISQGLVCEINWRGEFESCLIGPLR